MTIGEESIRKENQQHHGSHEKCPSQETEHGSLVPGPLPPATDGVGIHFGHTIDTFVEIVLQSRHRSAHTRQEPRCRRIASGLPSGSELLSAPMTEALTRNHKTLILYRIRRSGREYTTWARVWTIWADQLSMQPPGHLSVLRQKAKACSYSAGLPLGGLADKLRL